MAPKKVFTIGHSNITFKDFLAKLKNYGISHVVDVRTMPRSRFVPWSNQNALQKALGKHEILYTHLPALGGLRHTNKASINTGWENKSFRGFADYMQTEDFAAGMESLLALIKTNKKVVIMCAESLPWRCHRSLIADALLIRNYKVFHILSVTSVQTHTLTAFAKVDKRKRPPRLYYPGGEGKQLGLKDV